MSTAVTVVVRRVLEGDPIELAPGERIVNVIHSVHQPQWDHTTLDVFVEVAVEELDLNPITDITPVLTHG